MTGKKREEGMPAKKMKAKARPKARKPAGAPHSPPACDPRTGLPRKTKKTKKK
jgi:hypothetical protein